MREVRDIVAAADAVRSAGGRAVLATIVEVTGSTYRRPGARMLIPEDGDAVGLLSGGCLESDLAERARAVLESGRAETVVYDMTGQQDLVWGLGLGCAGSVTVLLERWPPAAGPDPIELLRRVLEGRRAAVLATVYASSDTANVVPGAHLGLDDGSAGEPGLDRAVRADLGSLPVTAGARPRSYGGSRLLLECLRPPLALAIFGGGPDARPLVRLAGELGWQVSVIDHRPAFALERNFPGADAVELSEPQRPLGRVSIDERTAVVVMTHKYLHDAELLGALLPSPAPYLGLLGPRERTRQLLAALSGQGIDPDDRQLARVHAPVGLDLGAETPEEIALAIAAEIAAVFGGRDGGFLRDRAGPLHQSRP